jgi:hypothetical protein
MPTKKQNIDDDAWEVAQAAFETACQLSPVERFEALKKAGQLRYEAEENERSKQSATGASGRGEVRAPSRHGGDFAGSPGCRAAECFQGLGQYEAARIY